MVVLARSCQVQLTFSDSAHSCFAKLFYGRHRAVSSTVEETAPQTRLTTVMHLGETPDGGYATISFSAAAIHKTGRQQQLHVANVKNTASVSTHPRIAQHGRWIFLFSQ